MSSQDGRTWETVTSNIFGNTHILVRTLVYGNGRFIGTGEGGRIAYFSNNGISWTHLENEKRPFFANPPRSIAYGQGIL
jgi:hypothetical protein